MTKKQQKLIKQNFLAALEKSAGIITPAAKAVGVNRETIRQWRKEDPDFDKAVEEVNEIAMDFVETALMKNIQTGDTQAIIFYCKTKLKHRGYTDKQMIAPPPCETEKNPKSDVKRRIAAKKTYIIKMLKQQGKYSEEMSMQVTILAQLLVKTDDLARIVMSEDHKAVTVELSREGNERTVISGTERLYLDYVKKCQEALRATGMNKDCREKIVNDDGFGTFLKDLNSEIGD